MFNTILPSKSLTSKLPLKDVPNVSVVKYLIDRLKDKPRDVALIDCPSGRVWSSEKIIQNILNSAAAWINIIGLKKGDTVCFISYNNDYYAFAIYGVIAAGGIVTGTSDKSPYREIRNVVEQTEAKFIVASENNFEAAAKVKNDCQQLKKLLVNVDSDIYNTNDGHSYITLKSLLNYNEEKCSDKIPKEISDYSETIAYLFTSGSTGMPKGAIKTHENALNYVIQFYNELFVGPSNQVVKYSASPLSHIGGFMTIFTIANAGIVSFIPAFDEEKVLGYIEKYKITEIIISPSAVNYLANCDHSKYDISSLIEIYCGGSPLPVITAEKCLKNLPKLKYLKQAYGMTEIGAATIGTRNEGLQDFVSIGTIVPGNEIKVCDNESGERLDANKIGEICIKGPQVTKGYFNRPKETAQLFDSEGFLRTGDAGCYDNNGNIFIVDRYKDIVKCNGQVCAPSELESILLSHPSVAEAAVIGLKDDDNGEVPKAFVVKKNGNDTITADELIKYVDEKVTIYKKLRGGLEFRDHFEKTSFGKINKTLLRNMSSEILKSDTNNNK